MGKVIRWFTENTVAANLVMLLILTGGLLTVPGIKQEVFPELASDRVTITVDYLGAAPEEVEESVCVRIEEAVQGLTGIKRIVSQAREGQGIVTVELLPDTDGRKLLDEVKARVDTIDTFPEETEKPVIQELVMRRQVINVAVSGRADEHDLRRVADRVRDDISSLAGISHVQLSNARPYEISIEVSEHTLRRYGLTFDEVTRAVERSSLDLPGGSVKTEGGEILLRVKGQAYVREDFEAIPVRTRRDGTRLLIRDIASVRDGFAETDQYATFDGEPAVLVQVFRVGSQSALKIAAAVNEYVQSAEATMPAGIRLTTWQDDARVLRSRLDLLLRNGKYGLALVFMLLALFLRLRLAFWVSLGIPLSFLGALWLLPSLDISVNVISLFAFIVALGIVVDDAIVIGENIYTHYPRHKTGLEAAVHGARELSVPVVFAVATTMAAFVPLVYVPGNLGKVMQQIAVIVIATLSFSLVESLLVLPAHLRHRALEPDEETPQKRSRNPWVWVQSAVKRALAWVTVKIYRPLLMLAIRRRYLTASLALALLLVTAAATVTGRVKFVFFPPVDADNVVAFVTFPQGTSAERVWSAVQRLEAAAHQLENEMEQERPGAPSIVRHVLASVGGHPFREDQGLNRGKLLSFAGSHLGEVNVELLPAEERTVSSSEVANRWREIAGTIPEALEVSFSSSLFSTGEAVNVELSANRFGDLKRAAEELKAELGKFDGVFDIADSFRAGKREVRLSVTPNGQLLGVEQADVARQVRQAFYGEEAQRIQRGRDEVKVMVRYPESERRSLANLNDLRVRLPDSTEVPFTTVASVEHGRGYATIQRTDRRRVVSVTADVDQQIITPNEVARQLKQSILPELMNRFPGLSYSLEGEQREQSETMGGLLRGFVLALLGIYALLAVPFRSYSQPLIVMSAIPFGLAVAVWAHLGCGLNLSMMSVFGMVALTGVLVNDSLVLVDYVNRRVRAGEPLGEAVLTAGEARLRPILLTSLTTFAGLTPLLLERSLQAQFLIPMAVSLGFGVLLATFVTLLIVPVGYTVLDDTRRAAGEVVRRLTPGSGSGS